MACFPHLSRENGYATLAALVLCMALAMIVAAFMGRSVASLRLARADFDRAQAEAAMMGAQLAAAAVIIRSDQAGPFAWTATTELGWIEALAEPEDNKLTPQAASLLSDDVYKQLGVSDPSALKAKLAAVAANDTLVDLAAMDNAFLWKACGPSFVSPVGVRDTFKYRAPTEPTQSIELPTWRTGQLWRIRVATSAGWRDDRILRFTGDAYHPAATAARRISRSEGDGGRCESILSGAFG